MGSEGCTGVPQGGRWKGIFWQRIQWNRFETQKDGNRILFIVLGHIRPSASCEYYAGSTLQPMVRRNRRSFSPLRTLA